MPARTLDSPEAESSRKRPRGSVSFQESDDDGDSVIDVQSAQSNLRGVAQRKRPRISDVESAKESRPSTPSSGTQQNSDDDFDEETAQVQARTRTTRESPDSPSRTQYEVLRDGNFDHLRDEAADDQRATQRLRFGRNIMGENHVADNGIIQSITCVNFMCHERLHCELGPLLNFIVGENGSGKSAILTAITLCLGGKASSTNRGGSLKSFVKEGRERAVLSVKIKNQGEDAYHRDIYGDSITVERHFSKTGTSGFKVKSAAGQTVSTKRQEVEDIVEYYALQVDNPLNVLSQDNARQFLNASTKAQKYKFFIEGVQLQQLDNDYRLISESLEQMIAKVPEQEDRVKHAKENYTKAKRLKEAIEGNRQIRIKYRTLRNQMVWAQVVDEERELEKRENYILEAKTKVAEAEAELEEKKQGLTLFDDKISSAEEDVKTFEAEAEKAEGNQTDANALARQAIEDLEEVHKEEREAHSSFQAAKENIKILSQKIAEEEKRLADTTGEAHASKMQELEEVRAEIQRIQDEISNKKTREKELGPEIVEAKQTLGKLSDEYNLKRKDTDAAAARVKDIQKSTRGLYDGYDRQLPNLLKLIAEEKGFAEKPIGPFGAHIKILKPEWSSIIENQLGKNLSAFLVMSVADKTLLNRLLERLRIPNCAVIIGRRNPLDITGKEPPENLDTILRVLKIDNPLVRDQLIIMNSIEQVLLVPSREEAQEVLFGPNPPPNAKACICFHDKIRGQGLRLHKGSDGISTDPIQPNAKSIPRMQSDTDSQLAYQTDVLRQLQEECTSRQNDMRRAQQDVHRLENELAKVKRDANTLDSDLRKARVLEDTIQAALDKFDGADGRLQGLRTQLAEAEATKAHHANQYSHLNTLKRDKNRASEEAAAKLKAATVQKKTADKQSTNAKDKLNGLKSARHLLLVELNEGTAALELSKEDVVTAVTRRDRKKQSVDELTVQASQYCETRMHIPENETYKTIEAQYTALGKRLAEEEKKTGMSDKQVNEFLVEAKTNYEKAIEDLESIKKINSGLVQTLNQRLDKWRKFQRYISASSRANFIYLLSERGFRGKLMLDHERKALDLQVEPDKTEKRAAGRNTKTLSGGEKSFSSICLLLAIWEAMGSPLRCLDEFDVFMDNVNRAISTNMLITAARRSVNRQYIFITPNAIEGRSTLDKDVKIIRLTDPRQRTLADH
ncbi:P-loop containing nucleoside triphosphate hydrolase protein [Rhypophila sp. PSN 637]